MSPIRGFKPFTVIYHNIMLQCTSKEKVVCIKPNRIALEIAFSFKLKVNFQSQSLRTLKVLAKTTCFKLTFVVSHQCNIRSQVAQSSILLSIRTCYCVHVHVHATIFAMGSVLGFSSAMDSVVEAAGEGFTSLPQLGVVQMEIASPKPIKPISACPTPSRQILAPIPINALAVQQLNEAVLKLELNAGAGYEY